MNPRLVFASLLVATTAACSPVEDELAAEDTTELSDEKADATGNYTYYTVTRDLRRCVSPYCGGYWMARVNRTTTRCHDGSYQASCYVADADWARLGVSERTLERVQASGELLVRATIGRKAWAGIGTFGELRPTEAWLGQGPGDADGVYVKVSETGVRCFTTPCNSFRELKLNGSGAAVLAELGWDESGADEETIGAAINELFEHDLIISGDRYTVRGPGGTAKARTVTQFFVRAHD
jgi:hypothetical protein